MKYLLLYALVLIEMLYVNESLLPTAVPVEMNGKNKGEADRLLQYAILPSYSSCEDIPFLNIHI